jgi:hypothetical protein
MGKWIAFSELWENVHKIPTFDVVNFSSGFPRRQKLLYR